jgi:hypothetical protein
MGGMDVPGLSAKFEEIFPHLDERQRRLLMGAEARSLGRGGIRAVARAAGVREATVSRGVDELDHGEEPLGRVRRPGGGRKRATEIDPGLLPALLALVTPTERGDPVSPLLWTTRSTRSLAAELTRQGHRVGADTVADLLRAERFSLQGDSRTLEGAQSPDRDAQFAYINAQVRAFLDSGDPVVSVDTKKKELVGNYANPGQQWRPAGDPVQVRSHDFVDEDLGKVAPYGVYDLAENSGWVNVGTDHDTAAFAVESLRRWWNGQGAATYPHATRLLVTADAGGSNGYRTRAWKAELAAFALRAGLAITVCHFPPGTSKWNQIEHRLFSRITHTWRGQPLTSHEVVLNTIAATTTSTGLTVHAELDTHSYPTGVAISDRQLAALPLDPHVWHGEWNYTLRPEPYPLVNDAPPQADRPSPDHSWLCHPALTGLATADWDRLLVALTAAEEVRREAILGEQRGHPRRHGGPTIGRRSALTLADRLAAALLHDRLGLPERLVAELFGVHLQTINRQILDTRALLDLTGKRHLLRRADQRISSLEDLYRLADAAGITRPAQSTTPAD